MRPNVKKWIEELRSGKHPQTKGTLKEVDKEGKTIGYCCLGVYVAKVQKKKLEGACREDNYGDEILYEGDSSVYSSLDKSLGVHLTELGIEMNDNGKSFEEIADAIEAKEKESC